MPDLESLLIHDVLQVSPDLPLAQVVALMAERLGQATHEACTSCVCLTEDTLLGVITQADVVAWVAEARNLETTPVREVLHQVATVVQEHDLNNLAALAQQVRQHLGPLPVVDGQGQWVGLLSRERLLQTWLDQVEAPRPIPAPFAFTGLNSTLVAQTAELEQQVASELVLTTITHRLQTSSDLRATLATVMTELGQFLDGDRLLVYQFDPNGSGRVVAEAVVAGWNPLLGLEIRDPHFAEYCQEAYRQGRTQVTHDVFTSGLPDCYIRLLAHLQVQATVVVPIGQADQLWGLLACQDCSGPHHWNPFEVNLLQRVADQIAIALQQSDRYQQLQVALQTCWQSQDDLLWHSRETELLVDLAQQALTVSDLDPILQRVTEQVAEILDTEFCGILEMLPNRAALLLKAGVGWPSHWIQRAKIRADHRSQYGYTLGQREPVTVTDLRLETRFSDTPFLHNLNIVSGVSVPIQGKDAPYGILSVHVRHQRHFSPVDVALLQKVADVLSAVVKRHQTEEELAHFFDLSLDLFCITHTNGCFQRVNSRFETLLGYPETVLLTHPILDFIHPEDRDLTHTALNNLALGLAIPHFENRYRCQDGTYRWFSWSSTPTDSGQAFLVGRDITQEKQTALLLQDQQRQLAAITRNVPVGVYRFVYHADGRVSMPYASEAYRELLGLIPQSIMAHPEQVLALVHPEDRPKLQAGVQLAWQKHVSQGIIEYRLQLPNGQVKWVSDSTHFSWNEQGDLVLDGAHTDISACKRAELALQQRNAELRAIFAAIPDLVFRFDAENRFQDCIFTNLSDLYVPPVEFIGRLVTEVLPATVGQAFVQACQQVRQEQRLVTLEYSLPMPQGEMFFEARVVPFLGQQLISVVRDISDRKGVEAERQRIEAQRAEAEAQLRLSEERFRQITEHVNAAFWITSAEAQLLYLSPGFERIWQIPCQQVMDHPTAWIEAIHPADRARVLAAHRAKVHTGQFDEEYCIIRPDGTIRWVHDRGFPIYNAEGGLYRIAGIAEDITEQRQTEQALQKSQRQYETLAEAVPVGIFRTDREGNALYLNERWCAMTGITAQAALGQGWRQAIHPEDCSLVDQHWTCAVQQQHSFQGEYRFLRTDRVIWIYVQAIPEFDEEGHFQGHLGTITDISDRKQAEMALQMLNHNLEDMVELRTQELSHTNEHLRREIAEREQVETALQDSQRFLELLLDSIPQSVFWKDRNSVYWGCNRNFARDVGMASNEAVVGRTDFDLPWQDTEAERYRQLDQAVITTDTPQLHILETRWTATGNLRWLEINKVPLHDSNGQVIGVLGSYEDITARIQAEEALRQSETRYRSLFEQFNDAIVIFSEAGQILDANAAASELFGENRDDLLAQAIGDLLSDNVPGEAQALLAELKQVGSVRCEARVRQPSGLLLDVDISARVMDTQADMVQAILRNISQRKRAEAEILKALEQEKELNALKSRFISMASHELRTPLTTILGSTELLQYSSQNWPEEKKQRHFEQIKHTVHHMTTLVNDVLLYSKAESDRLSFKPSLGDLVIFCRDVVEEMGMGDQHQHPISFEGPDAPYEMELDDHLLRQILVNLLGNALKYSPASAPVWLHLDCQVDRATLKIEDRGIGIPAQDMGHLYESFHRGTNVGTVPGTGLGLAIVNRAVETHGGTLTVASDESWGTLVTVELPRYQRKPDDCPRFQPLPNPQTSISNNRSL